MSGIGVTKTVSGTVTITVVGTDDGTNVYEIITTDGLDGIVIKAYVGIYSGTHLVGI